MYQSSRCREVKLTAAPRFVVVVPTSYLELDRGIAARCRVTEP